MQNQKAQPSPCSRTVLMIRPANFRSNEMTCINNYYQSKSTQQQNEEINRKAVSQFDCLVAKLRFNGVQVIVVQDDGKNDTPDSVFPNNWISFHDQHKYITYPMFAANRRPERKIDIYRQLQKHSIRPQLIQDYSQRETDNVYLEGTGSLVLDRVNKIAYAALSSRTHQGLALQFCSDIGYNPCFFKAYQTVQGRRQLIYHTNVMLWIGSGICGICLESIDDQTSREVVLNSLLKSKLEIVQLSEEQINNFAGNTIMLQGNNAKLIVMSTRAYKSYSKSQVQILNKSGKIVESEVDTIEKYGGGSARCMIAEIF